MVANQYMTILAEMLNQFAKEVLAQKEIDPSLLFKYNRLIRQRIFNYTDKQNLLVFFGLMSEAEFQQWQRQMRGPRRRKQPKPD
jgi:hypothetical protein